MKRRVLLAGIGSASIGVGAAFGSGAFTSIESDRDVNLNVQGDSSAQIIFRQGSGTGAARLLNTDSSNVVDIIEFSQTSLNEQSKTIFKNALEVENNTDDSDSTTGSDGLPVDFYIKEQGSTKVGDGDQDVLDFRVDDDDGETRSIVQNGNNKNAVQLPATGDTRADIIEIDIVVDLRNDSVNTGSSDNDLQDIEQVTFVVEAVGNE